MYLFIILGAAVLVLLWTAVRGLSARVTTPEAAESEIIPVDILAFRNLIDVSQEDYLRQKLSPREFRAVQRTRYLATAEYLRRVAKNASVILRLGQAARATHRSEIEEQGAQMTSAAVALRLFCLIALAQAYAGYAFPGMQVSVGSIADSYDRLTAKVWAMRHVWIPAQNVS